MSLELERDSNRRILAERSAASVEVWESLLNLDDWQNLTYGLNGLVPAITNQTKDRLSELANWLLAKDWPLSLPLVRDAFTRHKYSVLNLTSHMASCFEQERNDSGWHLETKYKRIEWNPSLYKELIKEYRSNAAVTWWLSLDLGRSVNLVIAAVREEIDPLYRFDTGMVLSRDGSTLIHTIQRPQYSDPGGGTVVKCPNLEQIKAAIEESAKSVGRDPDDLDASLVEVLA